MVSNVFQGSITSSQTSFLQSWVCLHKIRYNFNLGCATEETLELNKNLLNIFINKQRPNDSLKQLLRKIVTSELSDDMMQWQKAHDVHLWQSWLHWLTMTRKTLSTLKCILHCQVLPTIINSFLHASKTPNRNRRRYLPTDLKIVVFSHKASFCPFITSPISANISHCFKHCWYIMR